MNLQLVKLGSQSKVSVSAPISRGKPNLAFKAPTYNNRDSRFLSTRQGGSYTPAFAGLILILLALTVKVSRGKTTIDVWLHSPVINIISLQILQVRKVINGDKSNLQKSILPPRYESIPTI